MKTRTDIKFSDNSSFLILRPDRRHRIELLPFLMLLHMLLQAVRVWRSIVALVTLVVLDLVMYCFLVPHNIMLLSCRVLTIVTLKWPNSLSQIYLPRLTTFTMNVNFVFLEAVGVGCGKTTLFTLVVLDLVMYGFHMSQEVVLVNCLVFTIPTAVLPRLSLLDSLCQIHLQRLATSLINLHLMLLDVEGIRWGKVVFTAFVGLDLVMNSFLVYCQIFG